MPILPVFSRKNPVTQKRVEFDPPSRRTLWDLPRSHKIAFSTILTVTTPTFTYCSSFHLLKGCRIALRPLPVRVLLKAVVDDTWVLRTISRDIALPFLFIREQTQMVGFWPCGHQCYCSRRNIFFKCPDVILSFLCFEARSIKKERLLALPHLRTIRETFASYRSSIP